MFHHLHNEGSFSENKTKFYICELILAIEYLHKNNIIYRDLKPENILLGEDGHIKMKTIGKMLDNQLTVEGLFTNVIMTKVENGSYKFLVHDKDCVSTVKTPIGMFEDD